MGKQSRIKTARRLVRLGADAADFGLVGRNRRRLRLDVAIADERPVEKQITTRADRSPSGRGPASMAAEGAAARRVRLACKAGVAVSIAAGAIPAKTLRRRAKLLARVRGVP